MRRVLIGGLTLALVLACSGKPDDTGESGETEEIIGDGETPVIITGYYWCASDVGGNPYYFFSVEAQDQQGPENFDWRALVWFMDGDDYLTNEYFGEDKPFPLTCQAETNPKYCQGSLLESELTGPCSTATWGYQAEISDIDGHTSERYVDFVVNPNPPA